MILHASPGIMKVSRFDVDVKVESVLVEENRATRIVGKVKSFLTKIVFNIIHLEVVIIAEAAQKCSVFLFANSSYLSILLSMSFHVVGPRERFGVKFDQEEPLGLRFSDQDLSQLCCGRRIPKNLDILDPQP